ncbi:hypothetical protein [Brasilonema bromeliae]|uniref:hypothetical protein n=1 Tax=Brasilonema bromeliae TaxID=383615 RepID=UPI00145F6182|nr:hypothetical protein [Brasilonema bromeliae]
MSDCKWLPYLRRDVLVALSPYLMAVEDNSGVREPTVRLLLECLNFGALFKIPALWVDGLYQRFFLTFMEMAKW